MSAHFFLASVILIFFCLFTAGEGLCESCYGDLYEPDTLRFGEWIVNIWGPPYMGEAVVPVIVFNDEPVKAVVMPFTWLGPMSMDTLYFAPGRPDVFDDVGMGIDTSFGNLAWLWGIANGDLMPPGTGPIAYLHFTVYDTGWAEVDTGNTATIWFHFTDSQAESWEPIVVSSQHHFDCQVGDVNCDGIINIGDVVFLVNYLYRGEPPPDNPGIGDVNGDGKIDVGDVVYLINFLYRGGPPPQG